MKFLRDIAKPLSLLFPRPYSRYGKDFREPIIGNETLSEFCKNNESEMYNMKFKAAGNDVTCSAFYDPDARLFIRYLMRKGDKVKARDLVEETFKNIKIIQLSKYHSSEKEKVELNPFIILHKALENVTPVLQIKKVKRGGSWYDVPTAALPGRGKFMGLKFLIEAGKNKPRNERFTLHLAYEIISASQNTGKAVQKKKELHKYCEHNRAYAHYRWN